jgi:hypothetical protein
VGKKTECKPKQQTSNKRSETSPHIIAEYPYGTLNGTDSVGNCMTFSGNNCKILFMSLFTHSAFAKLKNSTKTA